MRQQHKKPNTNYADSLDQTQLRDKALLLLFTTTLSRLNIHELYIPGIRQAFYYFLTRINYWVYILIDYFKSTTHLKRRIADIKTSKVYRQQ